MKSTKLLPFILLVQLAFIHGCGGSSTEDTSQSVPSTDTSGSPTSDTSALRINEIVASASNDGPDWIELYALTDISDLSIYSMVDDDAEHAAQALPAVSLGAGEFLLVLALDEADTPSDGSYYVSFKLGSDDAVTLFKNDAQVDQLDWDEGEAAKGYSYGLYADGDGSAQTLSPTPNAANQALSEGVTILDTFINNDAALRINEIVAKDASGAADWIELYAAGADAVFLGDYTLSDEDGELFPLPDITLASGQFYRIYATDEAIEGAANVDFKLGSSDQVNLYLDADLVDQIKWNKGAALSGYSYGRYPDGSDALATLVPSPETSNTKAVHGPLVISEVVASQLDDSHDWFELYNNSAQAIQLSSYSVIDSSDDISPVVLPEVTLGAGEYIVIAAVDEDPGSYFAPFKLGKEDELSLILNDETVDFLSWQASEVSAGYSFGLVTANEWTKNTLKVTPGSANELPPIYNKGAVESIYFEIDPTKWQALLDNALEEEYYLSSVTYQGITLDEVGIRTKGNSSLNSVYNSGSERFSFNIDINEYVSGQKLFGMKKFVLNNMFNDPSYMREYIAYELLENMGVATPEHSYVNVYVNGELKGLYLMIEFVNESFIEKHYANTQGDLYKPDGVGSDLQWIDDNYDSYTGVELKTNEDISDNGAFMHFVSELEYGDALEVIDDDSVMRYMAVSVALSNLDSYHGSLAHNYYIYEQDGVFSLLPWDLNEAFGSFNRGCNRADIRGLYIDEPTDGPLADKPLIAHVFADDLNLQTYHGYLQQLIDGALKSENFTAWVAEIDAMISQHVLADPTAFYSYAQYKANQTSAVDRFYGLTSFIDYRVNNMSQQLSGSIPSSGDGQGYCN